ncbi:hypothetical protein [Sediminibacterium sp.]|uniref:hypothetical protein n=1 Tax=Sediminibacterium sp. TaxID=1917865 RepID=UPI0025F4D200|nr:hypothetical protein [Sediminibacterium sp.]MBT9484244.1 hypothetical protein [Sediminibacterium sp.]
MSIIKYLKRIRYIDFLIRRKATGNIASLAKKLSLSKRSTFLYLSEMKELGFPIQYGNDCDCYYYNENGKIVNSLFVKDGNQQNDHELGKILSKDEYKKTFGGKSPSYFHNIIEPPITLHDYFS